MRFSAPLPIAEPVIRGNRGKIYSPSSFGVDFTTFGPDFSPDDHFNSDRYRKLDFSHQYPKCTRHDGKMFDFQGRFTRPGGYSATQSLIGSAMPTTYVPLDQRRPSNPYRLSRLIVRSFTNLVFGEGRFPKLASDDPQTEIFCEAVAKQAEAAVRMVQARNIGGSVGTVGISWRFYEGQTRVRVHNGKQLVPHSWIDREQHLVEHVSELTMTERPEWDPKQKKKVMKRFWSRRDWTPNADIQFVEMPIETSKDEDEAPEWIVDEDNTFEHGDDFPHFVWCRNGADDDDGSEIDGECDFDGQYESLDNLDMLLSVLSSGTMRNLDPTLVLAMDESQTARAMAGGISKGSGNALNVGSGGQATYLELSGSAVTAGIQLFKETRSAVLETAQCVVPSTAELTSAGTSAVAQKMLFAPMLSATSVHRTQYGAAYLTLFDQILKSARRRYPEVDGETGEKSYALATVPPEDDEEDVDVSELDDPNVEEVDFYLDLPPHVTTENVVDEHGEATGETTSTSSEVVPGAGKIWLVWPAYFEPTSVDIQAKGTAISTAAGMKPVLSQQSATEIMADTLGQDPKREWTRVSSEARAAADVSANMFTNGAGGGVGDRDELPPGASPKKRRLPRGPAAAPALASGDDGPETSEEKKQKDHQRYLQTRR